MWIELEPGQFVNMTHVECIDFTPNVEGLILRFVSGRKLFVYRSQFTDGSGYLEPHRDIAGEILEDLASCLNVRNPSGKVPASKRFGSNAACLTTIWQENGD